MDARIASSSGPRCNHTDLPASRSVATAVYGIGSSSMVTGPRMSRTASRIFSARSTPAAVMRRVEQSQDGALASTTFAQSANSSSRPAACNPPTSAPIDEPAISDDLVAAVVQFLDHPDVGVPAGAAAAERQRHPGPETRRARRVLARSISAVGMALHLCLHRAGTFVNRDPQLPAPKRVPDGAQPHSSLAAARAAMITPACRASVSAAQRVFQLPAPPDGERSAPSPGRARSALCRSPGWASIHTFAA